MIRRSLRRTDDGYTMVMVLLAFFLVTGLALVALATATRTVASSRGSQDYRAALSAAQAGVQDYISRLNTCDTYWQSPCADSTANDALTGWATVPGTAGSTAAQYKQQLLSNPLSTLTPGMVRLKVTGKVNGTTRVIVTDLAKTGFLEFLYYSDYETFSPSSTAALSTYAQTAGKGAGKTIGQTKSVTLPDGSVISAAPMTLSSNTTYTLLKPTESEVRAGCQVYYYDGRSTFPRTIQWTSNGVTKTAEIWPTASDSGNIGANFPLSIFQCLTISFGSNDVINGPMHTNDAIALNGNATFSKRVGTSWPSSGATINAGTNLWYNVSAGTPQGNKPVYEAIKSMPPTNQSIKQMADGAQGGTGCLYTGPTRIEMRSDGKIAVQSPYTKSTNAGCIGADPTSLSVVAGPQNGVIYVQDVPASTTDPNYLAANANCASTSAQPIAYYTNNTGDTYDCTKGDVFIQGTTSGKFTVASSHDILITNNLTYNNGVSGADVLGLVAQNNVMIYHPANERVRLMNVNVDAAIASVQNSFTVQNYDIGNQMGTLTMRGVIVQKFRGPVARSGSSGYLKNYIYDSRLMTIPPPSFLQLQDDAWELSSFTEQDGSS